MDGLLALYIYLLTGLARFARPLSVIGFGEYREWHPGEKLKVLLVGYNGARNTGADVRVVALARQLKEIFDPDRIEITVMALDTENLSGYFDPDVNLYKFTTVFPLSLYRACSANHIAVIAEGSTLKSTFADALTLYFCEASGIMRSQKKPCIAYGTEAGQMSLFLRKNVKALCGSTYFIARTQASMNVLRSLGLQGHTGTDSAWLYDGAVSDEEARKWLLRHGWDGKKPLVGAAVIDPFCWPVRASLTRWIRSRITGRTEDCYDKWYFYSRSPERSAAFARYLAGFASALNHYCREKDAFVVIIGMEKLDSGACRRLEKKLKVPCTRLESADHNAALMTGVLRQLSLLATSRYHAAVLSMDRAIPIAAVSMDERLDSLMEECGLHKNYLLHTTDADLGRKLYAVIKAADADRDAIRESILRQTSLYREQLDKMGQFLKAFVKDKFGECP